MEQLEKVYKSIEYNFEQYKLDKTDLKFGIAKGSLRLACSLDFITFEEYANYIDLLIKESNNA